MAVAASELFDEDGLRMLCAFIVRKAAKDYYKMCLHEKDTDFFTKRSMQEFFRSNYYNSISSIDGNRLMHIIERRAKRGEKLFKWGADE